MTTTSVQEPTVTATPAALTEGRTFTHHVHPDYCTRPTSYEMTEMAHDGEIVAVRINGRLYDLCKRCGQGYGHFMHNGINDVCYSCHSAAFGSETTEADAVRRHVARQKAAARAAAKREAEAAAYVARRDAELAAWTTAHAELAEALQAHLPADQDFPRTWLARTAVQLHEERETLSDGQVTMAERILAEQAATVEAGHWGTVGKRETVEVTVVATRDFDSQYGTRWLVTMKTAEGHTLKTWTSGSFVSDALDAKRDGTTLTIKTTVKEHGDFNGTPETTLTRVALA